MAIFPHDGVETAMNIIATLLAALLMAGCASKPAEPSWRNNAASSLDSFTDAYLKGDSAIAAADFARARAEMASTGRADLVAHAELVRCAVYTASLVVGECKGFAALAPDATPAERAYAAYLAGQWQGLDAALLPVQHQAIARGTGGLAGVTDPLSRLVAAGTMLQAGRIAPADIVIATDTASAQGWRRPLLMWLAASEQRAIALGDTAELARIRRRIALASSR
jgi:hypothetical protein